jgi:hypothetical protein
MASWEDVRRLALTLPEVQERTAPDGRPEQWRSPDAPTPMPIPMPTRDGGRAIPSAIRNGFCYEWSARVIVHRRRPRSLHQDVNRRIAGSRLG